jgi:hypothetical protein
MGALPADWEERKQGRDCPMCGEGRPDENDYGIAIKAGEHSDTNLQRVGSMRGYFRGLLAS